MLHYEHCNAVMPIEQKSCVWAAGGYGVSLGRQSQAPHDPAAGVAHEGHAR